MENIKHYYIATCLLCKPGKRNSKVCGSKKSFAVAEVQKNTANVPQTCGFSVADHLLLFCGICSYGIEFKFAVPSTAEKPFNCSARRTVSLALHQQRNYHLSFSLVLLIETLLSVLQHHPFWFRSVVQTAKKFIVTNGLNNIAAFTAKHVSPVRAQ